DDRRAAATRSPRGAGILHATDTAAGSRAAIAHSLQLDLDLVEESAAAIRRAIRSGAGGLCAREAAPGTGASRCRHSVTHARTVEHAAFLPVAGAVEMGTGSATPADAAAAVHHLVRGGTGKHGGDSRRPYRRIRRLVRAGLLYSDAGGAFCCAA